VVSSFDPEVWIPKAEDKNTCGTLAHGDDRMLKSFESMSERVLESDAPNLNRPDEKVQLSESN
jgi:hypothetical protein